MDRAQWVRAAFYVPRDPPAEMEAWSRAFAAEIGRRRTLRQFSDRPVSHAVIEACLEAAGTAPSGAHLQPWHFVVIGDAGMKRRIREAAEAAKHDFYSHAPHDWARGPGAARHRRPQTLPGDRPCLIAVFAERYGITLAGVRRTDYHVTELVGIATGPLLAALHHARLATLTHTPSPMGLLSQALDVPPTNGRHAGGDWISSCGRGGTRLRRKPLEAIVIFRWRAGPRCRGPPGKPAGASRRSLWCQPGRIDPCTYGVQYRP